MNSPQDVRPAGWLSLLLVLSAVALGGCVTTRVELVTPGRCPAPPAEVFLPEHQHDLWLDYYYDLDEWCDSLDRAIDAAERTNAQ